MTIECSGQGPKNPWSTETIYEVKRIVRGHVPSDHREAEARLKILEALERLPSPLDEDADIVHVTGSAVLVGPRGTILHVHRRLGRWMQPGGHLDVGETPAAGALRESQEETGLVLRHPAGGPRLLHVDVHPAAKGHTHLDLRYLLIAEDEDPVPPPGESPQVRWWSWDDAERLCDEALIGALRVARAQPEAQAAGEPMRQNDPDDGRGSAGAAN